MSRTYDGSLDLVVFRALAEFEAKIRIKFGNGDFYGYSGTGGFRSRINTPK